MAFALSISFCGVFWDFFTNPCVMITNVFVSESQNDNNLYCIPLNKVLNSHISVPTNFLKYLGS